MLSKRFLKLAKIFDAYENGRHIIEGKRAITAEMSLRFGLFFGMSEGFWLNLQKDYDLRLARREKFAEFPKNIRPFEEARV